MPIMEKDMADFTAELRGQGHGPATVVKYHREAAAFAAWLGEKALTAERVAEYRDRLTACRTTTGANGAISALNKLFAFLGRQDCRLRGLPVQRRLCRDEGRELTQGEYKRLLTAARRRKRERLLLAMEAICATGIRVSELKFFTVEAVRVGKAVVTNKGKTREVYLPGKLCKRLREYAKAHGVISGLCWSQEAASPWIGPTCGGRLKRCAARQKWRRERSFPTTCGTCSPGPSTELSGTWPAWRTSWATPAWTPPGSIPWRRG